MSIGLARKNTIEQKEEEVGEGVKELADDIEAILAYSNTFERGPFTEQDIVNRFEEDDKYFRDDLEHVSEAIEYLQDEDRVKQDIRLDVRDPAYSVKDYDSI